MSGGLTPTILTSVQDGDEYQLHNPGLITPRETIPKTYWTGDLVDLRAGLDVTE